MRCGRKNLIRNQKKSGLIVWDAIQPANKAPASRARRSRPIDPVGVAGFESLMGPEIRIVFTRALPTSPQGKRAPVGGCA